MNKLYLCIAILLLSACATEKTEKAQPAGNNVAEKVTHPQLINVVDASPEQCPAGGKVYTIFLDQNSNNSQDSSESPVSTQIVCNGLNGMNGHSLQFQILPASTATCPTGGSIIAMALDINNHGFYSASDPGQQSVILCNGVAGASPPPPAYSPMDVIMPCGNTVSYKEILLRLSNGQVLAAFSENITGLNTRLSLIPDGTFMNSDGSSCIFTLSTEGNQRTISWNGQVQLSWPISY